MSRLLRPSTYTGALGISNDFGAESETVSVSAIESSLLWMNQNVCQDEEIAIISIAQ